jgi:hypothetical protein
MAFTEVPESATLGSVLFSMAQYTEEDGPFLMGRERGQHARSALERELGGQHVGEEPVAIDFRGVKGMSVPFADAFFVPLLSPRLVAGYYYEHPVVVVGAGPDVAETLDAVLTQRNLAVVALEKAPDAQLLGGEASLRETLAEAAKMELFSANDLADRLGLTAQAANNRLKQLVQLGALTRVAFRPPRGGREYRYRVPRSPAA